MWRPWGKSTVQIDNTSSSASSPFSCSSFKDIQTLCLEEPSQHTIPSSCRKASIFHRVRVVNSFLRALSTHLDQQKFPKYLSQPEPNSDAAVPDPSSRNPTTTTTQPEPPPISIPGAEQRIVVYFTSLRVVRSTFEDCKAVRSILRGFRVSMDERDLSMDSRFQSELQGIMGQSELTLPRVFIDGRYIGGAEEVRQLHESGELKKFVEGLPAADLGVCDVCGGYGFLLCDDCNGSRKLYTEKAGFKTCTECNEYGLIRCHSCSWAPL